MRRVKEGRETDRSWVRPTFGDITGRSQGHTIMNSEIHKLSEIVQGHKFMISELEFEIRDS